MSEGDETVRCWLVDRVYDDKGLVRLTYAPPSGERAIVRERAANTLGEVTAAIDVDADRLDPVDEADRERFASEAQRMADTHDPDDVV